MRTRIGAWRLELGWLVLAAAVGSEALAQPAAAPAPAGTELRVAMAGTYWPLHAPAGPDLAFQRLGLEADLAQALGNELGLGVRFLGKEELGTTSMQAVAEGKADIAISSITPSDERRQLVDFTEPYLVLQYRLAKRKDTPAPAGLGELAGRKVAVPRGPTLEASRAQLSGATIVEVPTLAVGLKQLQAKKVDFVVGEDVGLQELLEKLPQLELAGPPVGASPLAIAVPKGQAARYDEALKRISGYVSKLQKLYRPGQPSAPRELVITNCQDGDQEERFYGRVMVDRAVEVARGGDPGPDVTWFNLGWFAPFTFSPVNALGTETHYCVSAPVRVVPTTPRLDRLLMGARAKLLRSLGARAEVEISENAEGWVAMADGVLATVLSWSRTGGCEQGIASCSASGYLVLAVKGAQTTFETFTLKEESTPEEEGT